MKSARGIDKQMKIRLSLVLRLMTVMAITPAFCMQDVQADNIEGKIARQQGKIGSLNAGKKITAAQATRADNATYKISQEEQKMLTKHRGKLTRRDKAKLQRQLNKNARIIQNEERNRK